MLGSGYLFGIKLDGGTNGCNSQIDHLHLSLFLTVNYLISIVLYAHQHEDKPKVSWIPQLKLLQSYSNWDLIPVEQVNHVFPVKISAMVFRFMDVDPVVLKLSIAEAEAY